MFKISVQELHKYKCAFKASRVRCAADIWLGQFVRWGGNCSPQDSTSNDDEMMKDILWWSVCVCFQSFCLLPQSDYIHMKRIDDDVDGCLCGKSAKNACYELIEFPQTMGQQESTEREKLQYFSYSSILSILVTHMTIHDIHFYETFLSLVWQKRKSRCFWDNDTFFSSQ